MPIALAVRTLVSRAHFGYRGSMVGSIPPPGASAFDVLHEIALLIAAETELDRVLERVLRSAEALLDACSSSVFLRRPGHDAGRRFTTLHTGEPHWEEGPISIRPGGITDSVLTGGRSVAVEDLTRVANASPHLTELGNQAILAVPLRCQRDVIGVLYVNFPDPRPFRTDEIGLIETLGAYAATAVRNADLIAEARRAAERQRELLAMVRAVESADDLGRVFQIVCRDGRRLLGADTVSVLLTRPNGLLQGAAMDTDQLDAPKLREAWEPDDFIRQVIERRTPGLRSRPANDPSLAPAIRPLLIGVEHALLAPLFADAECLGLIAASWQAPGPIGEREFDLAETIARHLALAIQGYRAQNAAIEAARLEGAVQTAQAAAHELSQPLAVVVGYSELIETVDDVAEMRHFASLIGRAAGVAAAKLDRFRNVMRFVELRFGTLDPILDIEEASRESA